MSSMVLLFQEEAKHNSPPPADGAAGVSCVLLQKKSSPGHLPQPHSHSKGIILCVRLLLFEHIKVIEA